MMHKPLSSKPTRILLWLWAIAGLLLACLILLSTLTEQDNIFQPWNFISPRFEEVHHTNLLRSVINLLVTIGFAGINLLALRNTLLDLRPRRVAIILLITATGMLLGLIFFYTSFCCMSPPTYYLGIPFAWLYGEAVGETGATLQSETGYLLQNFLHIPWLIYPWSLIANLNFWLNSGIILIVIFRKQKLPAALPG